jgi:NADP-dependent 3-hydroxy acid dehydrogenase YdfG
VSNDADVLRTFESIRATFGGIDVLVNNAGTATMQPLADGDPNDWRAILSTNVAAPALCIQEALRDMATRDEGQIVNISSIYAYREQVPNFGFYHASKTALRSLTNTLRAELAANGTSIRVGMISPGMVATEFRNQATGGEFEYESYFETYQPILPCDVAEAVVYMLSTRPHIQVQDILLSPLGQGI